MELGLLDREIAEARRQTGATERGQQLEQAGQRLFVEVRNHVERHLALHGSAPTRQLHDEHLQSQKLSNIERRDFARMHVIVSRIARRLAERHARRKKRRVRGQLDFRKTLRKNAAYDGVMFETFWRRKVIDRPRIVAICDVSGSVRRYARFLLLFLHSLGEQVSDLRSFAFTNHLVEVTGTFASLPVEQAVDKVMQAVGGSGTDHGQTLLDIHAQLCDIDRRTTVLILGDARNDGGDAQAEVMKLLYQRAPRHLAQSRARVVLGSGRLGDETLRGLLPHRPRMQLDRSPRAHARRAAALAFGERLRRLLDGPFFALVDSKSLRTTL